MTHTMVIKLGDPRGDGLVPHLVCTEAEGAAKGCRDAHQEPSACSLVEAFEWDTTAAMEDYCGEGMTLYSAPITVQSIDEYTFEWDFAQRKAQRD